MKHIRPKEINVLLNQMSTASEGGDTPKWQRLHHEWSSRPAQVLLPIGELVTNNPSGHLWAWVKLGLVNTEAVIWPGRMTGLDAQGLEACVAIETNLMEALLFYSDLHSAKPTGGEEEPEPGYGDLPWDLRSEISHRAVFAGRCVILAC